MDLVSLEEILTCFPSLNILVLGDYFLDKYLTIERALSEKSVETDLEAYQVTSVRTSPGAAGTVVSNLRSLGANVQVLGVIGDTGEGYELRRGLDLIGANQSLLLVHPELLTPTYVKPMMHDLDGRAHEMERLDIKNRVPLPEDVEQAILERLSAAVNKVDTVIISEFVQDDNCGVVTRRVREEIASLAAIYPNKVFIADSRPFIGLYRGVIIKCNVSEALNALSREKMDEEGLSLEEVKLIGRKLARRNGRPVFITIGAKGMVACNEEGCTHVPTVVEPGPIDPVGAGDSALAGIACALGVGASNEEAALIGNLAASVTIKKIGMTGTANVAEILEQFAHFSRTSVCAISGRRC
jgi:rfaE bifunctional protein kinase chain/domain